MRRLLPAAGASFQAQKFRRGPRVHLVGARLVRLAVRDVVRDVLVLLELEDALHQLELLVALAGEAVDVGELAHRHRVVRREIQSASKLGDGLGSIAERDVGARRLAERARAVRVRGEQALDPARREHGVAARDRERDVHARHARVVEAELGVALGHVVGLGRALLLAERLLEREQERRAARMVRDRALQGRERGLAKARVLVELDAPERGDDVVGVAREHAVEERDGVAAVRSAACLTRAREVQGDDVVLTGAAPAHELIGAVDEEPALIPVLGELAREEQALDGRRLFGRAPRQLARAAARSCRPTA